MNSLIGALVLSPIVIAAYSSDQRYSAPQNLNVGYHMIYSGVSFGVGSGFGFVAGLGERFLGEKRVYNDDNFFNPEGSEEEEEKKEEMGESGEGMS